MKIETQYTYEKIWTTTNEADLLRMIEEETGSADTAKGTLAYIKEAVKAGKTISVGDCKFREKKQG
ncbi:hypothetical protein HUE88_01640 [Candidatus Sulfurimonas baltica]|uniref:Uncharacterized protein n=2 Tax=Candidatus Sulfurimonas baltica TaxID=2740404 RepID=A0A7S7LXS5_9BACT|nr:hypothetical protein HUE88_01640 [Candidatus Sulfurimonas baltica]